MRVDRLHDRLLVVVELDVAWWVHERCVLLVFGELQLLVRAYLDIDRPAVCLKPVAKAR